MCCHGDHLLPRPPDVPSGVSPTCVSKIGLSLEKCGAHVSRTETTDLNCGTVSENGEFSTENCASHVSRTGDETSTNKCGRLILRTGNEVSNNCGTSVSRTGDEDSNNGRTSVSRTGDEDSNNGRTSVSRTGDEDSNNGRTSVSRTGDEDANNCGTSVSRTGDEDSISRTGDEVSNNNFRPFISRTGDEASKAGCEKHELSAKGTNKESSENRTVILDSAHLPLPSRSGCHWVSSEAAHTRTLAETQAISEPWSGRSAVCHGDDPSTVSSRLCYSSKVSTGSPPKASSPVECDVCVCVCVCVCMWLCVCVCV